MTNTLQKKLNEILTDKNTNLLPENLKKGIRCLGVDGTLEASTSSGGVKQFNTVEEMNASTGNKDGDLAVVYRNEMKPVSNGDTITSMTFPKTVVFTEAITSEYRGGLGNSSEPMIYLDIRLNASYCDMSDMNGTIPEITYTSTDGITYTRTDTNADTYEIGETTVRSLDEHICKFIQTGKSIFDGVYKYSESNWSLAPTQLTTTADYVYEKEFYGKNGVETGMLTVEVSNSFADTNAEVYNKIQNAYDNMQPRILTDTDKTIDKTMLIIPAKSDGTALLDISAVTDATSLFQNCRKLTSIPLLNTSNVTNATMMFEGCSKLTSIPLLDTSNVTDATMMFESCDNLVSIPLLNTSKVTTMYAMFHSCKSLTTIPLLNTSKVTSTEMMFYHCTNLTEIPMLDTANVTDMSQMFENCTNLVAVPSLNTSKTTTIRAAFTGCTSLTTITLLDTNNVTNMYSAFYGCTNLTTVPLLDTSKTTSMSDMFGNCTSLSDDSLNNILAMCINATKIESSYKTLQKIGLTSEQATKCTTLSNYSAFTAAGWTTGY